MSNYETFTCPFQMLAAAAELSLEGDFGAASMFVDMARSSATEAQVDTVAVLAMCVSSELSRGMVLSGVQTKGLHSEFHTVQYWFKSNYSTIAGAAMVDDVTCYTGDYRPDFYVIVDGEKRPVECKKSFTERSRNQLDSYLKKSGASVGYAVAFELKCELPPTMIFVECPRELVLG